MPADPRVSLLMPCYNSEKYIAEAIDSALAQTMPDFELLVRDDGSGDNTVAIVEDYADRDPRVRLFEGEHLGAGPATKALAALSRGEYVGLLDSDDILLPGALAATTAVLDKDPAAGMVYTDYWDMSADGSRLIYGNRCKIPYSPERLLVDLMTFHFRLIRRSVILEPDLISTDFPTAWDYDMCLKISERHKIVHLAEPFYKYRIHRGSISTSRRHEQIMGSKTAVQRALERRGMADKYEVAVEIISRFTIIEKATPEEGNASG